MNCNNLFFAREKKINCNIVVDLIGVVVVVVVVVIVETVVVVVVGECARIGLKIE